MKQPIPDAALTQHLIALGKTGSGKSSALRVLVERLLDQEKPVAIIDPKGDWWGLKSSADGRRAGYPVVIFGGEHADVPLNVHAGAHVAELVATGNRPCIIDLGGWMVGDRTRFFIDFASTLFRHTRGPRWLVIDEVHNFAPQGKVIDPDAGKMLHWANRLASEGRGKGVTLLAASQRPQKVHKDFLTSCETLLAMRVIHPLDRGAIKDWIDGCPDASKGKEVLASLASMQRGTGWVWSPEIGFGPKIIEFPKYSTYDSFAPSAGARVKLKGWAEVDLEEVKAKLAGVVQEAEANDPRRLRATIAALQRELADLRKSAPAAADPKALERAEADGLAAGRAEVLRRLPTLERAKQTLDSAMNGLRAALERFQDLSSAPPPAPRPRAEVHAKRMPIGIQRGNGAGDPSLGNTGKRRMLIALAQNQAGLTYTKLALLTGISQNGGTWRTYLGELRSNGYVDGNNPVRITEAGLNALGSYEPLPTGPALIDYWRGRLGQTGKRAIFDVLVAEYPNSLPQQQVADKTGIAIGGGTWRTYLGELRGLELIEGRGELRASEELF